MVIFNKTHIILVVIFQKVPYIKPIHYDFVLKYFNYAAPMHHIGMVLTVNAIKGFHLKILHTTV